MDNISINLVNLTDGSSSGAINSTSDILRISTHGTPNITTKFELILGYSSNNDFSIKGVTYTEFKLDVTLRPFQPGYYY